MEEGFIDVERTLVPLLRLLVSLFEEEGPALAGVSVSARDGVRNTPEMRDVCRENWRPNICIYKCARNKCRTAVVPPEQRAAARKIL